MLKYYYILLLFSCVFIKCSLQDALTEGKLITEKTFMRWPNATVPFFINPENFDHEQATTIMTTLSKIAFKTCIKFAPTMAAPGKSQHVMTFINPSGVKRCRIEKQGHSNYDPHLVLVGYECLKSFEIDMLVMRALGLPFEHNRMSRDVFIDVLIQNIEPGYIELFTKDSILPPLLRSLPYDMNSVMHFGERDYSKNGHRSIIFKNHNFRQNKHGISPTDVRKIEIIYGPECRKRDRAQKVELCQSYPGIVRRKREIGEPPVNRSLRVNPYITPPPHILAGVTESNENFQATMENTKQECSLKTLGVVPEAAKIIDLVYQLSNLALKNARQKYCNISSNASSEFDFSYENAQNNSSNSDVLGILKILADFAKSIVDDAVRDLTEFCQNSETIEAYQSQCKFDNDTRCPKNYRTSKSDAERVTNDSKQVDEEHKIQKTDDNTTPTSLKSNRRKRETTAAKSSEEIKVVKKEKKMQNDNIIEKLAQKDNIKENVAQKDNITGNVAQKEKIKENVAQKEKINGNVAHKEKINENVAHKEKINENVAHKEKINENVAHKEKINGNVAHKEKINENVAHKEKIKENIAQKDNIKEKTAQRENEITNKGVAEKKLEHKMKAIRKERLKEIQKFKGITNKLEVVSPTTSATYFKVKQDKKEILRKFSEKRYKVEDRDYSGEESDITIEKNAHIESEKLLGNKPQDSLKNILVKGLNLITKAVIVDNEEENAESVQSNEETKVEEPVHEKSDEEVTEEEIQKKADLSTEEAETDVVEDDEEPQDQHIFKKLKRKIPKTVKLSQLNKEFYKERKWPDGEVIYAIEKLPDYDIDDLRERLVAVNSILKEKTCVKIREVDIEEAPGFDDYLILDNSPDYVTGRVGKKQNFGSIELFEGGQHTQHTAMMVMAMLGFYFEVARSDRDKHIRVHYRHIRPDKLHHFEKLADEATLNISYDYKSATHPSFEFWRKIGKTSLATVATYKTQDPDGLIMHSLGQNEELLSKSDILKINSVYGVDCFQSNHARKAKQSARMPQEVEEIVIQ